MNSNQITFIVPCYNGEKHLEECVNSLKKIKIPESYKKEIILVDNNSTDDSLKLMKSFEPEVRVIQESKKGRSFARNAGIKAAGSEILCFFDCDVVATESWFMDAWEMMQRWKDWSIVSSNIILRPDDDSWFEGFRTHQAREDFNSLLVLNAYSPCLNSAAFISRKSVLEEVGLFDDTLDYYEDTDLGRKVGVLGRPMLASKSLVYCYSGMDIPTYLIRGFKIGAMAANYYYRWDRKSALRSKIRTVWFFMMLAKKHFSFRYRADYMWFKALVNAFQLIGAVTSVFFPIKTKKFDLKETDEVKIVGDEKIIKINIFNGRLQVLHLNPFSKMKSNES